MENKINIIITMAGLGSRFRKAGYDIPKYQIMAKGKTLFEWSMDSLLGYNEYVEKYIFVVRKEDKAENFIREKCNERNLDNIHIVELDELTDGQATTCYIAIPYCSENSPIMVYNIDTYIEPYALKYEDITGDGYIPCFKAKGEHWSFVQLDDKGNVCDIKEKVRISDNCTLGAYYFSSAKLYKKIYEEYYLKQDKDSNSEKYIAPLYNYMLNNQMKLSISLVPSEKVHVLGTPEELNVFINKK